MRLLNDLKSVARDFLEGRTFRNSQTRFRIEIFLGQVRVFLKELMGDYDLRNRRDGGNLPPWAGKLAPIRPNPPRHLQALRDLPPSDRTHLLPRD